MQWLRGANAITLYYRKQLGFVGYAWKSKPPIGIYTQLNAHHTFKRLLSK
jgi:hypothetical protein